MEDITFSTCFYHLNSKFNVNIYLNWMNNLFSIAHHFNLVVYTDENTMKLIDSKKNPRIKVILKPIEEFNGYKYKDYWIKNHEQNFLLKDKIDWKVNMLWSEKIWFVNETIKNNYFNTHYHGWCDIGYFRNDPLSSHTDKLQKWANKDALTRIDWGKIHYACVNNNLSYTNDLKHLIMHKNDKKLPIAQIEPNTICIAGGFFLLHKEKIEWWKKIYEDQLVRYFENNYLVKDDQIILDDCIFTHKEHFNIYMEFDTQLDNWFMFQRILNPEIKIRNVQLHPSFISSVTNKHGISILMPIYNGIEFIEESVFSVIQQTWRNWELIIGINGHDKNSDVYKKAKTFELFSPQIKVLDLFLIKGKPNALNEMITHCMCDHVALLDVDDIWHYQKLEKQSIYLNKYDVIGTLCVYFGDINGVVPEIPVGDISNFNFFLLNPVINSSCIIKKELCFWNINDVEDYDLWLSLRKQNKTFFNLNEVLVKHRIHQTSFFNSNGKNANKVPELLQKHKEK